MFLLKSYHMSLRKETHFTVFKFKEDGRADKDGSTN